MRYFIDTEFIETGGDRRPSIDLISIGVVCEDGREYYAISTEFDRSQASEWVEKNVIALLPWRDPDKNPAWKDREDIRRELLNFIGPNPEFWGYYSSFDFVVFCWLFGNMIDLPKGWPKYCRDLKQMADMCGKIKLPKQEDGEHCALDDARWIKEMYFYLKAASGTFASLVEHEQASSKS